MGETEASITNCDPVADPRQTSELEIPLAALIGQKDSRRTVPPGG